jgi:hypothetical protein
MSSTELVNRAGSNAVMKLSSIFVAATLVGVAPVAAAADFDGSKPLICAPVEAYECLPDGECTAGTPREVGAPAFLRIDMKAKTIAGTSRTTKIQAVEESETQLLLLGTELGFGWTLALDRVSGAITVSFASSDGSVVLFGSCTPV